MFLPLVRPITSAAMMGASVWCAAGRVTVAAPDVAAIRLAVPASPWWFVIAAAATLIVPAWRRHPTLAAPALLATLPWWPVPLPAALLLWTGPLAWLPVGLAAACGLLESRMAAGAPPAGHSSAAAAPAAAPPPGRAPLLAGLLTLAAALTVAVVVDVRTPGGDEPHYLVITQSLINDGDLRIENNHRNAEYAEYYGGTIQPDFIQRGADGEIYSIHAPGLSALVAPAFAAFGYRGAQATVLAASSVAGALIWLIGWRAAGRADAAWFAWAAVVLTPTFLLQAGMIFPDAPGALAVAAGAWLLVRLTQGDRVSYGVLVATGTLISALPWLHTRFAVIAAALSVPVIWRLWSRGAGRGTALVAFLAVPAAAALVWFAYFWTIYGTPNPTAPYGADSGARLAYVPGGMIALLFDQQFGLLAYSPILAATGLGLWLARRSPALWTARAFIVVGALYAAAVATYWMWWAGLPATPARFLTAILPLAALPLGLVWSAAGSRMRPVLFMLLFVSLAITVITIGPNAGGLAWNTRDAQAQWLEWLGPVADLPRAWPSFFWHLDPEDLSTELPFVWHVGLTVGVLAGAIALVAAVPSGTSPRGRFAALATAWGLPLALMVAAVGGWRLNGVGGLAPTRSQLAVAGLAGQGRTVWQILPGRIERAASLTSVLRIGGEEPGRTDAPPPWGVFVDVPPGEYEVVVQPPTGADPLVEVRIGRSSAVLESVHLLESGPPFSVDLPAGARVLTVDAPGQPTGPQGRVELRPRRWQPHAGGLAQSFARYEAANVFFLDDGVFVEAPGFWVRGGTTAEFVVSPPARLGSLRLHVRNGAAPNAVGLTVAGAGSHTLALAPSEGRDVPLPQVGTGHGLHVRVQSPAGFRPSDTGPSEDRRYLGVWIAIDTQDPPPLQ